MNRGHNRETVFKTDDDYTFFLELVARYQERFGQRLFHYCLRAEVALYQSPLRRLRLRIISPARFWHGFFQDHLSRNASQAKP
jgi:hypothetical protein